MDWYVDSAHSGVTFGVKHMMLTTVRGRFKVASGRLQLDPSAPERGSLEVVVDAASVETGEARRDGHLRSADFFDTAAFPEIAFTSERITRDGDDYAIDGILTIRDVSRPIHARAQLAGIAPDPKSGGQRLGATASFTLDRRDFGLVWNQPIPSGVLVGDTVKIEIDLAAIDATAARAVGLAA